MQKQQQGKEFSFIYTIDQYKNVLFSPDATASAHINHCQGKPVFGAGEVRLIRQNNTLQVTSINNQSGLYKPLMEFFEPLKRWFSNHGFITKHTKLIDKRSQLVEQLLLIRAMR